MLAGYPANNVSWILAEWYLVYKTLIIEFSTIELPFEVYFNVVIFKLIYQILMHANNVNHMLACC